jgi:transcriptional regulator GlxA family with amidase domain
MHHPLQLHGGNLTDGRQCAQVDTSQPCAVAGPPTAPPILLAQVLAYIELNACQPLRLEQLASIACLSVCRFIRVFHRQYGMPPHRYICHVRIERVKALLRAGVAPAVVAGETGFYDQSHLSRHFKNVCGMTPGQYLSQLRAQSVPTPGLDLAAGVSLHCDDIEAAPCHASCASIVRA